jgi:hypothetical protein
MKTFKYLVALIIIITGVYWYFSSREEPQDTPPPIAFVPLVIDENSGQDVARNISDAWRYLPESGSACSASEPYGVDGGMRTVFCRALLVFSWKSFAALSPVPIFTHGPHSNSKLNLDSPSDFGYYNPKFVTWASTALIPAATNSELRVATQNVYDVQLKKLARTYFEVDLKLREDPSLAERERVSYLVSIKDLTGNAPQPSNFEEFLGTAVKDFGGYEPSQVRTSVMWWLRRYQDDTASLWHIALIKLLTTYDTEWLAEKTNKLTSKLNSHQS